MTEVLARVTNHVRSIVVWTSPGLPNFEDKAKAMNGVRLQQKDGHRSNPSLNAAIYSADFASLGKQRADILVTHEAPSCHPFGYQSLFSSTAQDLAHGKATGVD